MAKRQRGHTFRQVRGPMPAPSAWACHPRTPRNVMWIGPLALPHGGLCIKGLFDSAYNLLALRKRGRAEHGDHFSVASDQVLPEVPAHLAGDRIVRIVRQELIQRTLVITLDRDFREQIERDVLGRAERLDFHVGARFLLAEVVSREREDSKTFVLVLLVE